MYNLRKINQTCFDNLNQFISEKFNKIEGMEKTALLQLCMQISQLNWKLNQVGSSEDLVRDFLRIAKRVKQLNQHIN